ncbi:MAG: cation:proton antiporter [Melioribacteraceae bacterium]|nr:MAG: cation:proton antiporter [Melioribacteraceae bacterium]
MKTLLANIVLGFTWMLLNSDLSYQNFLEGFFVGYLILWVAKGTFSSNRYFTKIPKLIGFVFFFLYELILANFKVAYDIITPTNLMRPGVVAIPLDAKTDLEITLLANLITLTPGTLSMDVSPDKKVIYVHSMYIENVEEFRKEIKTGLERKLLEVMR